MFESILNLLIAPAYADAAKPATVDYSGFLLIGIMFVAMYFFMIRPQQKKAKEHNHMVDALKKGDEIVTQGGLLGKIVKVGDTFISIELGANNVVQIQRNAVSALMPKNTFKAEANNKAKK